MNYIKHYTKVEEQWKSIRPQNSSSTYIEGRQTGFRAREILKAQSTELYRTDSRIKLGTGAYRRYVPFPFPTYPHFSQEGTNQRHDPSI